jgi:pimeloyl-ACP methyl ester carboxylesterase
MNRFGRTSAKGSFMFLEIQGQVINTVSFGQGGMTVVGIAGAFGTWEVWQQPFELLSSMHRTVGYDHFGTGQTRVPRELVTFEQQTVLLVNMLDAYDIERCILAGDSNMSAVALEVAHRHPGRVDGLILVSGGIDYAPNERATRFVNGLRRSFDATLEAFVRLCLPEDHSGHLRAWLTDIIARTGGDRAADLVESFYDVQIRLKLSEIRVPTLIVHGALDAVNPLAAAEEMAGAIPGAQLNVIPDAGHVPTLSRPVDVVAAMQGFIRSL